jgi:hypothetical protein
MESTEPPFDGFARAEIGTVPGTAGDAWDFPTVIELSIELPSKSSIKEVQITASGSKFATLQSADVFGVIITGAEGWLIGMGSWAGESIG